MSLTVKRPNWNSIRVKTKKYKVKLVTETTVQYLARGGCIQQLESGYVPETVGYAQPKFGAQAMAHAIRTNSLVVEANYNCLGDYSARKSIE